MITSEKILTVIGYLKNALPLATREDHLDMQCVNVYEPCVHECGTVHCHAGWYMIGRSGVGPIVARKRFIGFSYGVEQMCRDLGFQHDDDFKEYFLNNSKLWGDGDPTSAFSSKNAFYHFTKRPNGAKNLQHIIDHWTEVYERFLVMEGKEPKGEAPKEKIRYVSVPSSITEQTKELIMQ